MEVEQGGIGMEDEEGDKVVIKAHQKNNNPHAKMPSFYNFIAQNFLLSHANI